MAFFSVDDPDFWGRDLTSVRALDAEGLNQGLAISRFAFGRSGDDHYPTMTALRMDPSAMLPRHAHDCFRIEIIVQGSMQAGERILKPGDLMISEPGEMYGPHVAGPEGCTTLEIFATNAEENHIILEEPVGVVKYDIRVPAEAKKIADNLKRQMGRPSDRALAG